MAQTHLVFFGRAPLCAVEDADCPDVILLQLMSKSVPPPYVVVRMQIGAEVQSLGDKGSIAVKNFRFSVMKSSTGNGRAYMTIRLPFSAFSLSGRCLRTVGLNETVRP